MSELSTIYTAIANTPVIVGSTNILALDPLHVPNSAETAILPCRLMLTLGGKGQGKFIGDFGNMAAATWMIQDLYLLAPEAQGIGLLQYMPQINSYMAAYHEMIRTIRVIPNTVAVASAVMSWQMTAQMTEWPQGGGRRYYAVSALLTIDETT